MQDDPLKTPVQYLPGVGPVRAELLDRLGICTVEDLFWYLPREVLDLSDIRSPWDLEPERLQTVSGTVVDRDTRELARGKTLTAVLLECSGAFVRGTWFNQPWMLKKFQEGDTVLFSGKPKRHAGRWEFNNPHVQWISPEEMTESAGVLPRYGLTEGLRMHELRGIVRSAMKRYLDCVPDPLTSDFCRRHKLPCLREAIANVHNPTNLAEFERGKHRLVFEDFLEFQLGLGMRRRVWKKETTTPVLPCTAKIDARIRRLFPFEFTAGQNQAISEIVADLGSGRAMHRLLQAEVGAGKTAVAVYAMLVTVAAGYQTALMAPTELLASQHWSTIERLLALSRVSRALLTGSLTPAQRRTTLEGIQSGTVQLVVGTQAVIQKDVAFDKLALAVIDEQHKFGVEQRAHFGRDTESPHLLVMTATPIPRSLCMTLFGDLDIARITDLPPGRQKVVTSRAYSKAEQRRAWDFIRKKLREGRQAYVVCPRIEASSDSTDSQLAGSTEEVYEHLSSVELKDFRVALIHGQMDYETRAGIMDAFRQDQIQALVSTTVIEVGVDVPNATLMVIYQAERFGLSQLHQLRGRIARGKFQGYCFLFSEATSEDALRRLQALESTSDGFKIAEIDFSLRGPGDVLGTRQHGQLPLKVGDLILDQKILIEARRAAFELIDSEEFDRPEFAPLKVRVLERFGQLMELPQTG